MQYNTAHAEHRWPLLYHDRIVSYQQYGLAPLTFLTTNELPLIDATGNMEASNFDASEKYL